MRTVIMLEDFNFIMPLKQLNLITELHNNGMKVGEISEQVKRNEYEVLLALIHQTDKGKITRSLKGV